MVVLLFVLLGGGAWIYFAAQYQQEEMAASVARGDYEIPIEAEPEEIDPADWRLVYPQTVGITIGGVPVEASVADTLPTRIKGLSDTPFLPEHVVKLFAFGVAGPHSIWMKDMNYAIDILWVDKEGEIVHIEPDVSPDTFPSSFSSPVPAWYVIEANAGFTASNTIAVGDEVVLPR